MNSLFKNPSIELSLVERAIASNQDDFLLNCSCVTKSEDYTSFGKIILFVSS